MTMKASKSTILILTTHTGGGHLNLAQSLKGMLDTRYNVAIVNPQSEAVDRYYTAATVPKSLIWRRAS